jgi:hypothetical protein
MAIDTRDAMAILNEEMNKADEKGSGLAPFFFSIKDGEKALIRPLLNMSQYVMANKHEIFNNQTKKYDVKAVCAGDLQLACQHCLDATSNKKLASSKRFILPVYVHAVIDTKTGKYVTYTDQEGLEHNVSGVRLLEMKRSSSILRDLVAAYNEDDEHDITTNDFVIQRLGDALETKYTVTPKKPTKFEADVPAWVSDRDQVLFQYADACPFKLVNDESDVPPALQSSKPASNGGKVKNAPDF